MASATSPITGYGCCCTAASGGRLTGLQDCEAAIHAWRRRADTQRITTTDHALDHLPERVIVTVAELANAAREGLLALAVGTGLQVLEAMLAEDIARLVGPRAATTPTGPRSATAASPAR